MARYVYKQPRRPRRGDSSGDGDWRNRESRRPSTVSQNADKTLGNIDAALASQEALSKPTTQSNIPGSLNDIAQQEREVEGTHDPRDVRSDEGMKAAGGSDLAAQAKAGRKRQGKAESAIPSKDLRASEEAGDSLYKPSKGSKHRKPKISLGKRKAAGLAGLLAGSGLGLSLILGTLGGGPLQVVYGAQGLLHAFSRQQSDTNDSRHHWIRDLNALKKGDFRYSRVGLIGAKWAKDTFTELGDAGVTFTGSDSFGRPTGIELDQEKIAKNNPEVKDMTQGEFDSWAKDQFGIEGNVEAGKISIAGYSDQLLTKSLKNARGLAGSNGVVSALKARAVKKFWGVGNVFHPFSRALSNKIRADEAAAAEGKKPADEDGVSDPEDPEVEAVQTDANEEFHETEPQVDTSVDDVKEAANSTGRKIASWTGLGQGQLLELGCTMKSGADAVIAIDRFGTVLPSIEEAMRIIGMASQIQAGGSDISMDQVGGVVSGFKATAKSDKDNGVHDAGTTVWDGGAMSVLLGSVKPSSKGDVAGDITLRRKSAFNPPHVGGILALANGLITASFAGAGSVIPDKCGWGGTIGQFVLGAIEQGVIGLINIPDGETATAATEVGLKLLMQQLVQQVVKIGEGAAVGVAEGFVLNQIKDLIVNSSAGKQLAADAFTGTQGGDLIAYGARAGANLLAAGSGGIQLAGSASSTLLGSVGQEQQQSFEHEPLLDRLADINDSRSLLGHVAMDIMPLSANPGTGISTIFSSILSAPGSLPGMMLSLFSGSAFADTPNGSWTGNYSWGFPQFGVPTNLKNADDPASNAEDLGKYLTSVCPNGPDDGQCGGDNGYTARIKACFGNDLTQSDGLWDVSPSETQSASDPVDIDPGNPTYANADCANTKNGGVTVCKNDNDTTQSCIWGRVILSVNDIGTLKAMVCAAEGTSCPDIGAPPTNDPPNLDSSQSGTTSQPQTTSMAPTSKTVTVRQSTIGYVSSRADMKWVNRSAAMLYSSAGVA